MQIGKKKSNLKEKAVPFAAGAAVTAGAVVGVAAAKALSDKKTRKKIVKGLTTAKQQAVTTVSDVVEKRGEMLDKVKAKAGDILPKSKAKPAPKRVKATKKATKRTSPSKKNQEVKSTERPTPSNPS